MTLLIHASTPTVSLGIAGDGHVVARAEFPVSRDLASMLADRIREFLTAHAAELTTLRRIVVHAGPGGFTSLRIGVTTANALAYALGIPVVGIRGEVGNLEALLESSRGREPASQEIVVPEYARPPNIGPVPN